MVHHLGDMLVAEKGQQLQLKTVLWLFRLAEVVSRQRHSFAPTSRMHQGSEFLLKPFDLGCTNVVLGHEERVYAFRFLETTARHDMIGHWIMLVGVEWIGDMYTSQMSPGIALITPIGVQGCGGDQARDSMRQTC